MNEAEVYKIIADATQSFADASIDIISLSKNDHCDVCEIEFYVCYSGRKEYCMANIPNMWNYTQTTFEEFVNDCVDGFRKRNYPALGPSVSV